MNKVILTGKVSTKTDISIDSDQKQMIIIYVAVKSGSKDKTIECIAFDDNVLN